LQQGFTTQAELIPPQARAAAQTAHRCLTFGLPLLRQQFPVIFILRFHTDNQ